MSKISDRRRKPLVVDAPTYKPAPKQVESTYSRACKFLAEELVALIHKTRLVINFKTIRTPFLVDELGEREERSGPRLVATDEKLKTDTAIFEILQAPFLGCI